MARIGGIPGFSGSLRPISATFPPPGGPGISKDKSAVMIRAAQSGGYGMDLGIAGRKAIVCASSRGLGRACAMRLAEAGCEVVVNGLDAARLDATAAEIRAKTGAKVIAVAANVGTPE